MDYKFLLKDLDGFSHMITRDCPNDDAACKVAELMTSDSFFVDRVIVSREDPDDPDGTIHYVGEFKYGE